MSNGNVSDFDSLAFQLLAGVQHGWMLDLTRDDVSLSVAGLAHGSEDCQVVGLGAAAGED